MKSFVRRGAEVILRLLVKTVAVLCGKSGARRLLKFFNVPLPYSVARLLTYGGIVHFEVANKPLQMRSHNTPIETTIDWRGIFNGREGFELELWYTLASIANVAYDVGANNGVYSLVASTHDECAVYAYEPVPVVFTMLQENILLSNKTQIVAQQKVVCDRLGQESLYVPRSGWVDTASIDKAFADAKKRNEQLQKIICEAVTLDSEIANSNREGGITLVKIDVEGAELRVLRGMQTQLRHGNSIVLIELLNQQTFTACRALLPQHYTMYSVQSSDRCLAIASDRQRGVKNYLCVPKSCHKAFQSVCQENDINII